KCTYIRKSIKEVATEDEDLKNKEVDYLFPENILEHEETRKIIAQTIRELPKNQQKYIIGYYYCEYSIKAMSALYSIPEGTIKSDLSRAKKTLRDKIQNIEKKQRITLHSISFAPIILFAISKEIKACEIPNEANIIKKLPTFSQNQGIPSHINSLKNNILFINKGDQL
ncbi:MAG: sigma factor-like helix-turn-helix DNA-binding protein, partial [Solobacterium sp.]|nr:sigma factor-like helix-turn-helix DNA-binding protein [Solobacterium sp.]